MLSGEISYTEEITTWKNNIKLANLTDSCIEYVNSIISNTANQMYTFFEGIIVDYPMFKQRTNLSNYLKLEWKKKDGSPVQLQSELKNCLQMISTGHE